MTKPTDERTAKAQEQRVRDRLAKPGLCGGER